MARPIWRDVTTIIIKRYMLEMSERGCKAQTVALQARAVRAFLNYCKRDGLIEENPFDHSNFPN